MKERILVIGAAGQIGTALLDALVEAYSHDVVHAADIRPMEYGGPSYAVDITEPASVTEVFRKVRPTQVYHLAAILSASGEKDIHKTWAVNVDGYRHVLFHCRDFEVKKVFYPSTIAVFGPTTPKENTPQDAPLLPQTVYGMSKVSGEMWSQYMYAKFGLDVRSLRYPGVIGWRTIPSGGTTDYAVEMFYAAIEGKTYRCYLDRDTYLPMMYMPDAIKATLQLMEASAEKITLHYGYNISGTNFAPKDLEEAIREFIPDFRVEYQPDYRQEIASTWVRSIDDSVAHRDWGWKPEYDLRRMTEDMLMHLRKKFNSSVPEPIE